MKEGEQIRWQETSVGCPGLRYVQTCQSEQNLRCNSCKLLCNNGCWLLLLGLGLRLKCRAVSSTDSVSRLRRLQATHFVPGAWLAAVNKVAWVAWYDDLDIL